MSSDTKTPDNRKRTSGWIKFLWFVAAWTSTFIFGCIVCLFILWIGSVFFIDSSDDTIGAKSLLFYGLVSAIVIGVWLYIFARKKHWYFHYSSIAIAIGLGINVLILLGAIVWAVILTVSYSQNNQGGGLGICTSIQDQQVNMVSATIPVGTDIGTGTAFAIDTKGHYITAYHVVEGAGEVYINTVDGQSPLTVIDFDAGYDLALLSGKPSEYFLPLTSSYAQADEVYALGYPGNAFQAGQASLSYGIVSRILDNSDIRLSVPEVPAGLEFVQTDAAINPGNSGGPLVNKCGAVGVVNSISDVNQLGGEFGLESEQGISFAISSKTVAERFKLPISE